MKSFEAKVGAFVVVCAIILAATIYSVSVARFNGAHVPYKTYLKNATGMAPGTAVLFGGITVGKIDSVKPDKADPTRIEILLEVKQDTPLNAQSVAEVGAVSLMSSPVLSISTGSNCAARLQPGSIIPSQETPSLDEVQHKVAALADTAQSTLVQVNGNLNNISGDARILLANLNDLTGSSKSFPREPYIDEYRHNGRSVESTARPDQRSGASAHTRSQPACRKDGAHSRQSERHSRKCESDHYGNPSANTGRSSGASKDALGHPQLDFGLAGRGGGKCRKHALHD